MAKCIPGSKKLTSISTTYYKDGKIMDVGCIQFTFENGYILRYKPSEEALINAVKITEPDSVSDNKFENNYLRTISGYHYNIRASVDLPDGKCVHIVWSCKKEFKIEKWDSVSKNAVIIAEVV